ncbi:DUF4956 domain-containing protein [Terrisporobacter vanillatitrophus]|uniref:DUF4956 domain-containing protein n=1 Tax=Terrisporobacter vanillatitrophus TaxID=3058402 RepID=UPI003367CB7C
MKETLYRYLSAPNGNITSFDAIEMMGIALLISMVIFWTYKITFSGVMYNRKFNVSLVMLTLVTTMVMIVIGSDIALSLGMVGALSIVRFRTAIKDPRDTGYIFWCIAIGISVGSGNYMIATVGSLFLFVVLSIFSFSGFGREDRYILIVRGLRDKEEDIMRCVFNAFKGNQLRAKNSVGNNIEIIYQIKMKNSEDKNIVDSLYKIEGVNTVNIVAQNGETIG